MTTVRDIVAAADLFNNWVTVDAALPVLPPDPANIDPAVVYQSPWELIQYTEDRVNPRGGVIAPRITSTKQLRKKVTGEWSYPGNPPQQYRDLYEVSQRFLRALRILSAPVTTNTKGKGVTPFQEAVLLRIDSLTHELRVQNAWSRWNVSFQALSGVVPEVADFPCLGG